MTLIFKVNRQGQNIHFRFFDISDPKNVRIDTKIKSVPRLQPEITKVIQKGVWPWFSRSCNEDRIFSLSPLDSLTPKTYPYVIFSKNSYGKTKIQGGGGGTHPPLGVRRWIFTLGVRGLTLAAGAPPPTIFLRAYNDLQLLGVKWLRIGISTKLNVLAAPPQHDMVDLNGIKTFFL